MDKIALDKIIFQEELCTMEDVKLREIAPEHIGSGTKARSFQAPPHLCCFKIHWHDTYEIISITSGSLTVKLDDFSHEYVKGEIAVVSPRIIHSGFSGKDGCTYDVIQFNVNSLFGDTEYEQKICNALLNRSRKIDDLIMDDTTNSLFSKCFDACFSKNFIFPLYQKAYTCMLFANLIENFSHDETLIVDDNKFNAVLQFINEHFYEPITTETIANMFSFAKPYFCRKFHAETGINFTKYIHILRIQYAQELIKKEPNISLSEIASLCGYDSPNYFSNTFKKITGFTPREWKRKFAHIKSF